MSEAAVIRGKVIRALFEVDECLDSSEPGRACRYCEAAAVVEALRDGDDDA